MSANVFSSRGNIASLNKQIDETNDLSDIEKEAAKAFIAKSAGEGDARVHITGFQNENSSRMSIEVRPVKAEEMAQPAPVTKAPVAAALPAQERRVADAGIKPNKDVPGVAK
jgi:hypothetical protein